MLMFIVRLGLSCLIVGCCVAFLGAFLLTLGACLSLNQPVNPPSQPVSVRPGIKV